ncbi:MAG TPA: hypothetical protein VMW54_10755 [Terriglobia bacterium]|nr:hypothetical protein [Terriglobia bacterium]
MQTRARGIKVYQEADHNEIVKGCVLLGMYFYDVVLAPRTVWSGSGRSSAGSGLHAGVL